MTAWGGLGRFIVDGLGPRDNAQAVAGALAAGRMPPVAELAPGQVRAP